MIIVLKQDAPKEKIHEFCTELEGMGLSLIHISEPTRP